MEPQKTDISSDAISQNETEPAESSNSQEVSQATAPVDMGDIPESEKRDAPEQQSLAKVDEIISLLASGVEALSIRQKSPYSPRSRALVLAFLRLSAWIEDLEVNERRPDRQRYYKRLRNDIRHRGVSEQSVEDVAKKYGGMEDLIARFEQMSGLNVREGDMTLNDAALYFHEAIAQIQEICYENEDEDGNAIANGQENVPPPPTFQQLGVELRCLKTTCYEKQKMDYQAMKRFRQLYCYPQHSFKSDGNRVEDEVLQRITMVVNNQTRSFRRNRVMVHEGEISVRLDPQLKYDVEITQREPYEVTQNNIERMRNWRIFYREVLRSEIENIKPLFGMSGVIIETVGLRTVGGFLHMLSDSLKIRHINPVRMRNLNGLISTIKNVIKEFPGLLQLIKFYYQNYPNSFRDHRNTEHYFFSPIHDRAIELLEEYADN